MDDDDQRPRTYEEIAKENDQEWTADHPLHGEKRPLLTPALGVLAVVVGVAAVVLLLTYLRYHT
jgi:hypothetical protein